MLIYNIRVN